MDVEPESEMFPMSGNILDSFEQVVTTMPQVWEYRVDGTGTTPPSAKDKA